MNRNDIRLIYLFGYAWIMYIIGLSLYLPEYKPQNCGYWCMELVYEPLFNSFQVVWEVAGGVGMLAVGILWAVWILEAFALTV